MIGKIFIILDIAQALDINTFIINPIVSPIHDQSLQSFNFEQSQKKNSGVGSYYIGVD